MHDTGTVLKISFILDKNLAKANCTQKIRFARPVIQ